jgi:Tat protein translocase TatB subunit
LFLFIFESIGGSELILIAIVALIVFGPRKLPQMAKTIGKTMAEFRNATNEFKSTWEKEAAFDIENEPATRINSWKDDSVAIEKTISSSSSQDSTENQIPAPLVTELTAEDFAQNLAKEDSAKKETRIEETEKRASDKSDWL